MNRYEQFTLSGDGITLDKLVACYRRVFAGPPWNEDWTAEQVEADLLRELARPGANCYISVGYSQRDRQDVLAFCWGYPISIGEVDDLLGLAGVGDALVALAPNPRIVYLDELGVDGPSRGTGTASDLFLMWLDGYVAQGYNIVALRTMSSPPTLVYEWFQREGYGVIASYNDTRGRVILARNMSEELLRLAKLEHAVRHQNGSIQRTGMGHPARTSDWDADPYNRASRLSGGA